MNIDINLLPAEIRLERKQKFRCLMLFIIGGFILLILVVLNSMLMFARVDFQREIYRLVEQRQTAEYEIKKLEPYDRLQTLVLQRETIIGQAVGETPDWVGLLADTGRYMPQDVWITSFTASLVTSASAREQNIFSNQATPAENVTTTAPTVSNDDFAPQQDQVLTGALNVQGYASDNISVAKWLENMHELSGLSNITCQFSSQEDWQGESAVRFEIKADLVKSPTAGDRQ